MFSIAAQTPITVRVSTESHQDAQLDNLLGDPFLHQIFGATVPKDVTVTSPATELTVEALPSAGRPADFSGAVGTFAVATDISADRATAGEPLSLRLHVSGSGNFDRVATPMLKEDPHFKVYPPKATFVAADAVGIAGEKTFEQPIVALNSGAATIPALSFSYFSPQTHRYEIARSAPLRVDIAAARGAAASTARSTPLTSPFLAQLRADHAPDGVRSASCRCTWIPRFWRCRPRSPRCSLGRGSRLAARRRSAGGRLSAELAALRTQAENGDTQGFFSAAQRLLEQRSASAPERQVRPDVPDAQLGQLLARAEEVRYAGARATAAELVHWLETLERLR